MNTFRLQINRKELQYDRDFGPAHRRGWCGIVDGSFLFQFEPSMLRAIWKLWRAK